MRTLVGAEGGVTSLVASVVSVTGLLIVVLPLKSFASTANALAATGHEAQNVPLIVDAFVLAGSQGKMQRTRDQAEIIISDDGAGIASANLNRIFDPFFTTRMSEGSSGLGLNIVHNIVTTILGGKIHVDSMPGVGTTVRITIPLDAPMHHEEPIIPQA